MSNKGPTRLFTPYDIEKQLKEMVKKTAESQGVKDPDIPASIRKALKTWMKDNPRGRPEPIPEYLFSAITVWDESGRPVGRSIPLSPETGRSEDIYISELGFKPKLFYENIEKLVKQEGKSQGVDNPVMPWSLRRAFDVWFASNPANEREPKVPKDVDRALREWTANGRPVRSTVGRTPEPVRPHDSDLGFKPKLYYKEIEKLVKMEGKRKGVDNPEMPRSIRKAFYVWFASNPANESEPKVNRNVERAIHEWTDMGRPVRRTPEPDRP